ncbi:hypothetical protein PUN28_011878 [Cardiocondyla obscurior]|uniref:Uncharacterized protein n=1 Tax=Cardiocondyla obscurior TaxID=286306 RepID=A0AAW2FI93_9HYME
MSNCTSMTHVHPELVIASILSNIFLKSINRTAKIDTTKNVYFMYKVIYKETCLKSDRKTRFPPKKTPKIEHEICTLISNTLYKTNERQNKNADDLTNMYNITKILKINNARSFLPFHLYRLWTVGCI